MLSTSADEPLVFILNGDRCTRNWVEATVTSAGLRALSFDTREELLPHIRVGTVACAVLDVSLPDGSGFELQSDLAQVCVSTVFLTRERCIASCVRAVRAGAVDVLTMPCSAVALIRALRDGLRQSSISGVQKAHIDGLRAKYTRLTGRERQVFALVARGLRNKQIAYELNISQITVQIHRGNVMKKMAARSFASLVRMADVLQPGEVAAWRTSLGELHPLDRSLCQ